MTYLCDIEEGTEVSLGNYLYPGCKSTCKSVGRKAIHYKWKPKDPKISLGLGNLVSLVVIYFNLLLVLQQVLNKKYVIII